MSSKLSWPIIILSITLFTGILVWSSAGGPLQPFATFLFMLVIPGLAITRLMRIQNFLTELILAIAISLGISILMSEVMVFAHLWSPMVGFIILVAISVLGAALQLSGAFQREKNSPME